MICILLQNQAQDSRIFSCSIESPPYGGPSLWRTSHSNSYSKFAVTILYPLDCSKNFCLVSFQARDFPDASDVWNLLLSGTVHRNSLSRQDVQELDNHTLYKLADVFNLPRRQSADKLNSVEHTEL